MELDCRSHVSLAPCGKGAREGDVHCCPGEEKATDFELVLDWCCTRLLHSCSCVQLGDVESLNLGGLRRAFSVIGAEHFSLNHRKRRIALQETRLRDSRLLRVCNICWL
jgi:hypothetical protein